MARGNKSRLICGIEAAVAIAAVLSVGALGRAEDKRPTNPQLDAAKDLFFAARYTPALERLERVLAQPDTAPAQRVEALKYKAFAQFLLNAPAQAQSTWQSLLALQPDYRLDPIEDSPDLVAFFGQVAPAQKERVVAPAPYPAPSRDPEATARPRRCGIWLCFVPFGVGQIANHQPVKATLFLSSELLFLGLNIGFFWTRVSANNGAGPTSAKEADRSYLLQNVSFGLFAATAIAGIIDAWAFP